MDLSALQDAAYRSVPGIHATPEIYGERAELIARYGQGLVYEVLARPGEDLETLYRREASRIVYHLTALKFRPLGDRRVAVALFVGETLYFLTSEAFVMGMVAAFDPAPGLMSELVEAWARGELDRTQALISDSERALLPAKLLPG